MASRLGWRTALYPTFVGRMCGVTRAVVGIDSSARDGRESDGARTHLEDARKNPPFLASLRKAPKVTPARGAKGISRVQPTLRAEGEDA